MRVYVNPSGQRENLGDSVLRRAYLDELRRLGELHVLAGEHPAYVAGLGLSPNDRIYSSKREWLVGALRHVRREESVFAVNAGEVVTGRNYASTYLWQSALSRATQKGGGKTVAMGIANREHPATLRPLLARFVRSGDLVTWRDGEAARMFGVGSVQPDWAVALGQSDEVLAKSSSRDQIAISLRGDRTLPSDVWFASVEQALAEMGSPRVVVVVQVMRDTPRARELASRFRGTTFEWAEDRSHSDHENRIRDIYRSCRAVISDRIHALIIGMTEGALPVGFAPHSPQKIVKTFSAISQSTPAWTSATESFPREHTARIVGAVERGEQVWTELSEARAQLRATSSALRRLVEEAAWSTP